VALALELREKSLAAEKLDQRLWPSVMTMRASSAAPLRASATEKVRRPGLSRSWKSRTCSVPARTLTEVGALRRVVPARGVQRIRPRRQLQAIGALVSTTQAYGLPSRSAMTTG